MASVESRSFIVGGAVRDMLLGRPVVDRDWVVVGATTDEMLAAGFTPVGADFPVFLHPRTHEEYALARTERKTAPGYRGFVVHADPSVTLEQDLSRRDLTINAMAMRMPLDGGDAEVIDPWGGRQDLAAGVLRHVSAAFAEDPVRVLRVARFAARFADFSVAPQTMALMQGMAAAGEVDALVPERVWKELARGLMEAKPSRLFEVLRDAGALCRLLPEVDRLWGVPQPPEHHPEIDTGVHLMMVLDCAAQVEASLPVRFACLCHDLGKGSTPVHLLPRHLQHEQRSVKLLRQLCTRLKVPTQCREIAEVVAAEHGHIHGSGTLGADALLRLLERCDAMRRPRRFADVLLACECDARGRLGRESSPYPQSDRLQRALTAALSIDTATLAATAAQQGRSGEQVGQAIRAARVLALHSAFGGTAGLAGAAESQAQAPPGPALN